MALTSQVEHYEGLEVSHSRCSLHGPVPPSFLAQHQEVRFKTLSEEDKNIYSSRSLES
jgi:hypothetical protein